MIEKKNMSVLFVCTGNICQSPTGEAVLRELGRKEGVPLHVESRGTHDYHVGEPPDERAQHHARRRGYDLGALRARKCSAEHVSKVRLFLPGRDVPDPYYGGPEGFEQVLDLVEAGCRELLAGIKS